ncbi:hypothetical protein EYF80_018080 [Liparis tanakae]|uniref:Uncharacterized protein n=1 Tax=Liparis tanakae TaxID=230148 RepID=A0A4Z2I0U7_9TELE|nr:hypothetical protein EYF80_018080 [Liparis tanakae]
MSASGSNCGKDVHLWEEVEVHGYHDDQECCGFEEMGPWMSNTFYKSIWTQCGRAHNWMWQPEQSLRSPRERRKKPTSSELPNFVSYCRLPLRINLGLGGKSLPR